MVASVMVVGTVGLWPASTAMLTRLVPPEAREKVYGINFMMLNAGLGIGGVISALIIDTDSLASFQRLYLLDGLSYVAYIVVLLSLPRGTGAAPAPDEHAEAPAEQPSWAVVLRDRTLLRVVGISVLAITFGYAQMEAGLAAYAVDVAEVPAESLGWAFAANTARDRARASWSRCASSPGAGARRCSRCAPRSGRSLGRHRGLRRGADRVRGRGDRARDGPLRGRGDPVGAGGPGDRQRPGAARTCGAATTRSRG